MYYRHKKTTLLLMFKQAKNVFNKYWNSEEEQEENKTNKPTIKEENP